MQLHPHEQVTRNRFKGMKKNIYIYKRTTRISNRRRSRVGGIYGRNDAEMVWLFVDYSIVVGIARFHNR